MHGAGNALDRALAALLAGTGARAVRLVDGSGVVVAALPAAPDHSAGARTDDPATVARLVGEAVAPGRVAPGRGGGVGRGGVHDVVVTTAGALHVLRPTAGPGAFLHLTAALDVDVPRARRMLADPALHLLVGTVFAPARVPRNAARAHDGPAVGTRSVPRNAPRPPGSAPGRPFVAAGPGMRDAVRVPRNAARPVPDLPRAVPDGVPRNAAPRIGAVSDRPPAVAGDGVPQNAAPRAVVPLPRSAGSGQQVPAAGPRRRVPAPRLPGPVGELPALAGLVPDRGRAGQGALAAQALAVEVRAVEVRAVEVLPRRSPAVALAPSALARSALARSALARSALAPSALALAQTPGAPRTGLPERAWAGDLDTMRRLLVGLRRLA